MKKTDLAHDTNLPYFLQRHPNGWAFYNRNYCNTITGIDQGADNNAETVQIPAKVLPQLNGGGEVITDYSTAHRIYLHDGSLDKNAGDYFSRLFRLADLGINPIAQKWFFPIAQKSSNIDHEMLEHKTKTL